MKKRFTPRIIASTVVILLGMVKTKNWNDGTSNFPGMNLIDEDFDGRVSDVDNDIDFYSFDVDFFLS